MSHFDTDLRPHVADIVSAYVSNHAIEVTSLPGLIQSVQIALKRVSGAAVEVVAAGKPRPAVPITQSVFPDYIVCLEDGKKLRMLKRHLKMAYDMEPDQYRAKWGLPDTYPMAAPNLAAIRSSIAKKIGLGRSTRS
jgi:predicted transcriptional regulator